MSYRTEKTESGNEIVWSGFEKGIGPSPTKGVANIQNANISTETGEVMCNVNRLQQTQSIFSGQLAFFDSSHLFQPVIAGTFVAGFWITISGSSHTGELPNGNYFISSIAAGVVALSSHFDPTHASAVTGFTAGLTANFTIFKSFGPAIAKATEEYTDGTTIQHRYYILDSNGLVWTYDTALFASQGLTWFLPDTTSPASNITGMNVLNGWLFVFSGSTIWCKPTAGLGDTTSNSTTWILFDGLTSSQATSPNPHYVFVGHQGKLYFTDGQYLGSIFPNSSINSGLSNVQSYSSWAPTAASTAIVSAVISGSIPSIVSSSDRVPAVFFTSPGGTLPSGLSVNTLYWIAYSVSLSNFQIFAAQTGGSAITNLNVGSSGTQYFNTFYPLNSTLGTFTYSPQRLNLPVFEVAQSLGEIGNLLLVGCKGNVVYPWNQITTTPSGIINVPENNVTNILTVNNMGYFFAGTKGNIYLTNGSTASALTSVPDYCAGIAGTPQSYIEPYFTWGDAEYIRGRVYFSILDQTSIKAGNCGGIWSFVPPQNFQTQQDAGIALRLENQNSYGNYNGYCPIIINSTNQTALFPQYWSAWKSTLSSPLYGIDFTGTTTGNSAIVETELTPVGTLLGQQKKTFSNLEFKLSTPLVTGESITLKYRQNSTSAWSNSMNISLENGGISSLSGYVSPLPFAANQWIQFQATLNPLSGTVGSTTQSYVRLTEIRLR